MLQNKPIVASTAVLRKSKEHSREIQTPASLVAGILGIKDWGEFCYKYIHNI